MTTIINHTTCNCRFSCVNCGSHYGSQEASRACSLDDVLLRGHVADPGDPAIARAFGWDHLVPALRDALRAQR